MKTISDYFDIHTQQKAEELAEFLTVETPFTVKSAGVSSHNIHYWIRQGLFPAKENYHAIRMNFVEFIWLKILSQLREWGVPGETLTGLFDSLVAPIDYTKLYTRLSEYPELIEELSISKEEKQDLKKLLRSGQWKEQVKRIKAFSLLQMLIAEAVAKRSFVSIAVFRSGEFFPVVDENMHLYNRDTLQRLKTETHVHVSITKLISDFISDERFQFLVDRLQYFSPDESKLLEQVRSGNYDTIKIRFTDHKMDMLELEKHEDVHKRIVEILSENNFQSIQISQQHGKISRIVRSVKLKL